MSRELNKIFDVQSRKARRDILDKFDLSADDKNKVLNKINNASGSGSGSEQSSTIEYIDVRGWNDAEANNIPLTNLTTASIMIKVKVGNDVGCTYPSGILSWKNTINEFLDILNTGVIAVAIDFNLCVKWPNDEFTLKENFVNMGIYEYINSLPRITKEEFYNLQVANPE